MIEELEPCPFCGGQAEMRYNHPEREYRAVCECGAYSGASYTAREAAAKDWNRRYEPDRELYDVKYSGDLADEVHVLKERLAAMTHAFTVVWGASNRNGWAFDTVEQFDKLLRESE